MAGSCNPMHTNHRMDAILLYGSRELMDLCQTSAKVVKNPLIPEPESC